MNQPSVVFDIDGPLFMERIREFFLFANSKGYPWSYQTYLSTHSWTQSCGEDVDLIRKAFKDYQKSNQYIDDLPTPGSQTAYKAISQSNKCYIATARPNNMRGRTIVNLEKYFGKFDGYSFDSLDRKNEVVNKTKASFVIEDNEGEIRRMSRLTDALIISFPIRQNLSTTKLPSDVIQLKTTQDINANLTDEEWDKICQQAWQEIATIVVL